MLANLLLDDLDRELERRGKGDLSPLLDSCVQGVAVVSKTALGDVLF